MNFGIVVARVKSALAGLVAVPSRGANWLGFIREPFSGAWQKNVQVETQQNILAFSAVYACITLIANDISKLRLRLMQTLINGIDEEITTNSPFLGVLRRPNLYQTRIQFAMMWIVCKLIHGNVYVLKVRDGRGVVTDLHILNPLTVLPLVAPDGSVYYRLGKDVLAQVDETAGDDANVVPASEIIHDRMLCFWHPLVGVSPIYACGASATQGIRIQANSAKFFENMSRPSGMLTAPGAISNEAAARLKKFFEENFSGQNIGRTFVAGDGLTYSAMTMPAQLAQLIEQLKWTVEDVARCFLVPLHKLAGGENPKFTNFGALNQDYFSQCLQNHIESIEILMDEGLALPTGYFTEFDLDGLLRMDPQGRMEIAANGVKSGILAPNEGRAPENLPPVDGGDTPYLQQQQFSLSALAKRDAQADPFKTAASPTSPASSDAMPNPADQQAAAKLADALIARFTKAATEVVDV